MFDVGLSELVLLAIVALVVLGPEKLPHAARVAGAWVGRIRRSVSAMQAEIEREVAAQELKTRIEKEFRNAGGGDLISELREEKQQLEASLQDTRQQLSQAVTPLPEIPPVTTAIPPVEPSPLLTQIAVPLEQVEIDGEKAYREWLETQRRQHPGKNPSSPHDSTPHE